MKVLAYIGITVTIMAALGGYGTWLLNESQAHVDTGVLGVEKQLTMIDANLASLSARLDALIQLHMVHEQ